jgi:hypothetical protein
MTSGVQFILLAGSFVGVFTLIILIIEMILFKKDRK